MALDLSHSPNRFLSTVFVAKHLGRVPKEGETFESQGYVFEVLDMYRHRVDKVHVMPTGDGPKRPVA